MIDFENNPFILEANQVKEIKFQIFCFEMLEESVKEIIKVSNGAENFEIVLHIKV